MFQILQDMTTALLHAHRCMLKDEPVPVPVPLNTIPDLIVPSHIIVPRCSGKGQDRDMWSEQTKIIEFSSRQSRASRSWESFHLWTKQDQLVTIQLYNWRSDYWVLESIWNQPRVALSDHGVTVITVKILHTDLTFLIQTSIQINLDSKIRF